MKQFSVFIVLILLSGRLIGQTPDSTFTPQRDLLGTDHILNFKDNAGMKVVSASRTMKNVEDLPITIHVITHEEIIKNQYKSLGDVLQTMPGMRVSQPGSGELGEIFQVRGLIGNSYTKILVNGISIKPSVVTGMPIGNQLPIRQAERIEVIYGPAAAVYGADAASGVINIITKKADKGTFVRGDINLGQKQYNYINFMIGGKAGKNENILQYSFYGNKTEFPSMNIVGKYDNAYNPLQYLQQQGKTFTFNGNTYDPLELNEELLKENNINIPQFIDQHYPLNYEGALTRPSIQEIPSASHMIGLNIEFRGFKISYHNMYRRAHSSIGKSTYLYKYNNPQNYWGENINWGVLSYEKELSSNIFSATHLSNLNYRMDNNSSLGLTYIDQDRTYRYAASNDLLLEQLFTITPKKEMEFVIGGSYKFSGNLPTTNYLSSPFRSARYSPFSTNLQIEDSRFSEFVANPVTTQNISGFMQGYYIKKKYTLMGGFRYDHNSLYGNSINPRLAGLYKFNSKTSVSLSAGMAFKAPSSSLTYQSLSYKDHIYPDSIHYLAIPNKNLVPERFTALELGIKRTFFNKVQFNVSFYFNQIKNLIIDSYRPLDELNLPNAMGADTSRVLQKKNYSNAISRLYGLEGVLKINNLIESINLDIEGSVTFTKKSESLPGLKEIGEFVENFRIMPDHIGHYKVSLTPLKNTRIHLEGVWMSKWLRVIIPVESLYKDLFKDVDGFYKMDAVVNYELGRNLMVYLHVRNVFDEKYGGLNTSGLKNNLPFNPQLRRNIRIGLTYNLN
jgi:hemoglobin/transferrin/lactoferrin receptor protein